MNNIDESFWIEAFHYHFFNRSHIIGISYEEYERQCHEEEKSYLEYKKGMIDLSQLIGTRSKYVSYAIQYDRCIQELAFHPSFMNKRMIQFDDIEDFFQSMGY